MLPGVKLVRLLGGDLGWGGAVGTLLLAGLGLVVMVLGALDLRHVTQVKPEPLDCAAWLAAPAGPRWVSLTGCELDLRVVHEAGPRRFVGLGSRAGAPVLLEAEEPGLLARLAAPSPLPSSPDAGAALLPEAAEPGLLARLAAPSPDAGAALLPEAAALTQPPVVTGWLTSLEMEVTPPLPGVLVLRQGAAPPRGQVVLRLVVGILALALALRPLGRRYLVEREGEATPGSGGGDVA